MKHTLADTAYDYMIDQLYSGTLRCGDKISEQSIIDQLNISRTPVREAIRRLATDGLIDFFPGTFARVHEFSQKEKQDLGAARMAVDSMAGQLAILHGSNLDFQNIMLLAADCERATDNNDFIGRIRLDCQFHTALVKISDNQELITIQERLSRRSQLMQIQAYIAEGRSFCDLAGHLDIINALMDRNVEAFLAASQNHLKHFYVKDSTPLELRSVKLDPKLLSKL